MVVNDGPSLSENLQVKVRQSAPHSRIVPTRQPRSGQWPAFRLGCGELVADRPFGILHDDDRLKVNYVEVLSRFAGRQSDPWICCHNLEVFSEGSQEMNLILPQETRPLQFSGREEVCLRYSHNFLPFPGTCFGMNPREVATRVQDQYREMADVVLLCECARMAKVFYEPEPILEYRRHSQQVSDRMDHAMEDKLQEYLSEATRGTRVAREIAKNLERRRAERFFSWAWESGRFSAYPFRKDFPWELAFRAVRNRKCKAAEILLHELVACFRFPSAARKNPAA